MHGQESCFWNLGLKELWCEPWPASWRTASKGNSKRLWLQINSVLYAAPLAFEHNADEVGKMTFLPFSVISLLMQVTVTKQQQNAKARAYLSWPGTYIQYLWDGYPAPLIWNEQFFSLLIQILPFGKDNKFLQEFWTYINVGRPTLGLWLGYSCFFTAYRADCVHFQPLFHWARNQTVTLVRNADILVKWNI